jgi:hypothetical protein
VSARRVYVTTASRAGSLPTSASGDADWLYFGSDAEQYYAARRVMPTGARSRSTGAQMNAVVRETRSLLNAFDDCLEYQSELQWHASNLAERNPYVSSFLSDAAALVAFARYLAAGESAAIVVVEDGALGRELARIASERGARVGVRVGRRVPQPLRVVRRAGRSLHAPKPVDRGRPQPVDVLLVTWAGDDNDDSGRDVYFGDLRERLERSGLRVGTFGVRPGSRPHDLARTLRRPARVTRPLIVENVDLTPTLEEALRREAADPRRAWSLSLADVGPWLARNGVTPRVIVHPFENQAWEKTLRIGVHRALPGTDVVGYQHTPTSFPAWFPCTPSRRDIADGQIPDRLALLGPRWIDEFTAAGYPPERLVLAPSLRYERLLAGTVARQSAKRALAACAGGFDEALELVVKTAEALGGGDIDVVVKTHPDQRANDERFHEAVVAALGGALPPNVTYTSAPVSELLQSCSVLLHTFSAVAWEALAAGVPTVFVA